MKNLYLAALFILSPILTPWTYTDPAFCDWLDYADTHWDVLASFSPDRAYDILAYPKPLAMQVEERIELSGCDY